MYIMNQQTGPSESERQSPLSSYKQFVNMCVDYCSICCTNYSEFWKKTHETLVGYKKAMTGNKDPSTC